MKGSIFYFIEKVVSIIFGAGAVARFEELLHALENVETF